MSRSKPCLYLFVTVTSPNAQVVDPAPEGWCDGRGGRVLYGSTTKRRRPASLAAPDSKGPGEPRDLTASEVEIVGRVPSIGPRAAPGLLPEGHVADHHGPVDRLAHVVD